MPLRWKVPKFLASALVVSTAFLALSGVAPALPEPEPLYLECVTREGRTIVYPATGERPEECYAALSIQLSVSPNPPRRSDVVTFSFSVSPGPTDCHDSFGNIFNYTNGAAFQRGITDQSDPFFWEVTCIGNGWESRRITIDIVDDAPPPAATCRDGIDNEGDGYVDWGVDPDCLSADDAENVYDSAPPPPPPSSCAYEAPVKLFRDANGGGDCWPFAEGQHDAVGAANDHASYVWIQPGFRALLCTDVYLQGACADVSGTSNAPWGSVPNDSVSSLRVERVPAQPPPPQPSCNASAVVVLYEHVNYGGRCWSFDVGEHASLGEADDQASSIKVAEGYFATVFSDASFAGGKNTVETSPDASSWTSVGHGTSSLLVFAPETLARGELLTTSEMPEAGPRVGPTDTQTVNASGCWKVWDGFAKYTVSGRHAFSMKLTVNEFCTNGSRITSVFGRQRWEERPRPPFPFSLAFGWEFRESLWDPGDDPTPDSRPRITVLTWKGDFVNCVFEKGCLPSHTYHGWIKIELRGNGGAYCSNSFNSTIRNCAKVRI